MQQEMEPLAPASLILGYCSTTHTQIYLAMKNRDSIIKLIEFLEKLLITRASSPIKKIDPKKV